MVGGGSVICQIQRGGGSGCCNAVLSVGNGNWDPCLGDIGRCRGTDVPRYSVSLAVPPFGNKGTYAYIVSQWKYIDVFHHIYSVLWGIHA